MTKLTELQRAVITRLVLEFGNRGFTYGEYLRARLSFTNRTNRGLTLTGLQATGAITEYRMNGGTAVYKLNLELIQNGLL